MTHKSNTLPAGELTLESVGQLARMASSHPRFERERAVIDAHYSIGESVRQIRFNLMFTSDRVIDFQLNAGAG